MFNNYLKKLALKLVAILENTRIGKRFALMLYTRRAVEQGVDPLFVASAEKLAREHSLKRGVVFLSLMQRLHRGEGEVIPKITSKFTTDVEFEKLLQNYPDIIEREMAATGNSTIFRWKISREEVDVDDQSLRDYVHKHIKWAINKHKSGYKSRDIKFEHSSALQVLLELKELFHNHDKRFFLSSGTLLGAIRENGFIASDYDLDIGVFAEELSPEECAGMFEGTPFQVISVKPEFVILKHAPSEISIDVFRYIREHGLIHYGTVIHRWWHEPFGLEPREFQGHEFLVPTDVEKHLTERYGNWRSPALFYDLSYDGPNRTYSYSLESILYLFDRANRAYAKGWRYYADQAAYALRDFFDIDYTQYLPRSINRKSIPIPPQEFEYRGKKVVLVAGGFREFDFRLVNFLKEAAGQGEYVVAAVMDGDAGNTKDDALSAADRAAMLRALRLVDKAIVVGDEKKLMEWKECLGVEDIIQETERTPGKKGGMKNVDGVSLISLFNLSLK